MKEKISVLIPTYNVEKFVEKAIRSIMIQTYSDLEIIIVDDCSTDNTLEICRENKFNVIDLPINLGIGGAVQTGYLYAVQNNYQ